MGGGGSTPDPKRRSLRSIRNERGRGEIGEKKTQRERERERKDMW